MTENKNLTDQMIEESLARAIDAAKPDMLEALMAELNLSTDSQPVMLRDAVIEDSDDLEFTEAIPSYATRQRDAAAERAAARKKAVAWRVMSCAAAILVLIGGMQIFERMNDAFAVVGLDVNPSIELTIDKGEKVVKATSVNDDGKIVLSDMKLEGSDVNVACNAVVGAMMTKGYLNGTSNSVLLSVRSKDSEKGRAIEKEISDNLNGFLKDSEIAPAILGQYVEDDEELDDFAGSNGISVGKAWLIRQLADSEENGMNEDALLELSTQELILLGENRNVSTGTSHGSADTSKYVGEDNALAAALEAAGLNKEEASNVKVSFGCDMGQITYEVGFKAGGSTYGFSVDAVTGEVIIHEIDDPGESGSGDAGNRGTGQEVKEEAVSDPQTDDQPVPGSSDGTDVTMQTGTDNPGTAAAPADPGSSGTSVTPGSTGGNSGNGGSDSGSSGKSGQDENKDKKDEDPGRIAGDVEDIDEDPGDITGDITDIDDEDGGGDSGKDNGSENSDNGGGSGSDNKEQGASGSGSDSISSGSGSSNNNNDSGNNSSDNNSSKDAPDNNTESGSADSEAAA